MGRESSAEIKDFVNASSDMVTVVVIRAIIQCERQIDVVFCKIK
jgi:hypothetical protein